MIYDTIVIGGGPAGMTAAIKVKERCDDASILLIDRNKKLGKKLYATGNGKCNVANTRLDLSCYHSSNEFFPYQIVNTESYRQIIEFFNNLGVAIYDDGGYLYPESLQASTVVWALSDRLKNLGVEIHTLENLLSVEQIGDKYKVMSDKGEYEALTVIAAPGGAAAPKLGGTELAYDILDRTELRIVPPHPALCRLKCSEKMSELAGVRARCRASLVGNGNIYDSELGEVQFGDGSLSGIVIFNLSMQCIDLLMEGAHPSIQLELVPEIPEEDVYNFIRNFISQNPYRRVEAMLNGLVNEKISRFIIERLHITAVTVSDLNEDQLRAFVHELKNMTFGIKDHGSYDESQAACGGVDTRQLRPDTMEADGYKGLYIAGEYVDVTGKCGGYNIMWAVTSGALAGEAAGKRLSYDKNK